MSDKTTEPTNGARSFEERVFERFDAMDNRFDRIEARIENLEGRQYDTKPMWEQALAAIAKTNSQMSAGFTDLNAKYNALDVRTDKLG